MKKSLLILALLALAGCERTPQEIHDQEVTDRALIQEGSLIVPGLPINTKGFKDCVYAYVYTKDSIGDRWSNTIKMIRCPNSDTTAEWKEQSGKTRVSRESVTSDR